MGEESYEAEGVIKTGFTFLLVLLRGPWEKWGWNGVRALTSPRLSKAFTEEVTVTRDLGEHQGENRQWTWPSPP